MAGDDGVGLLGAAQGRVSGGGGVEACLRPPLLAPRRGGGCGAGAGHRLS